MWEREGKEREGNSGLSTEKTINTVIPRKKIFSVPQENLLPSVRGILLTWHLYNMSQIERERFEFNLGHFISCLFLKVQVLCLGFACALMPLITGAPYFPL